MTWVALGMSPYVPRRWTAHIDSVIRVMRLQERMDS